MNLIITKDSLIEKNRIADESPNRDNKSFAIMTLGCKVNKYESEAMEELLISKGYQMVNFGENADINIINTCTVTAMSDKKSRQMIRRAKK